MFDPTNNISKQINEPRVYEKYWVSQEWICHLAALSRRTTGSALVTCSTHCPGQKYKALGTALSRDL